MGDVPRIFTGRHLPSTPKQDKSVDGDDDNGEKRVTIWNWREKRKLSGNSAPFKKICTSIYGSIRIGKNTGDRIRI